MKHEKSDDCALVDCGLLGGVHVPCRMCCFEGGRCNDAIAACMGEYEEGQMFIFEGVFDFQWDSVKIVNGIIRNPYYDLTELYEYAPQYEHGLLYDYHNALVFYNKGQVVDIEVYTTNNYHPYCFFEEDDLVVGTWYKELTPAEAVFECVRVSEGTHYYYFDLCDEERSGEL